MEKTEIIKRVNGFLVEEFEVEESLIVPDANLRETLEMDSLDFVDLVVIIESNFGFKIQAEDFISITTFQNFYDFIDNKVNNK